MPQNKENKTNSLKKKPVRVPHSWIANAVGCSDSLVKAVRIGKRSNYSDAGQRIEVAEMLIDEGVNKLLAEVKKVVQF